MSALLATGPPVPPALTEAPVRSRATEPRRRLTLRTVRTPTPAAVLTAPTLAPPPLRSARPAPEADPAASPAGFHPVDRDVIPLRSLEGPSADPGRVCASILQVAAEAMRGIRPLVQLARWVDAEIFDELAEYAPSHGARTTVRQRLEPGAVASVLASGRLWKVRVARICPHVAECTVLTKTPERVRAVVVRLEEHRSSWRATALAAL